MPRRKLSRHNLTQRNGTWYFQAVRDGRRVRLSLETPDLEEACALRDAALAELENPSPGVTLEEFAPEYLAAVKDKLKQSTYAEHERFLRPPDPKNPDDVGGLLFREFGSLKLDQIDEKKLKAFWTRNVSKTGASKRTGFNYLSVLSQLFVHAQVQDLVERNPTHGMRRVLAELSASSRERAAVRSQANPLTKKEESALLSAGHAAYNAVAAKRGAGASGRYHGKQGEQGYVACMLGLRAGLRLGEIQGLEWGDIRDGEVCVERNVASGKYEEDLTKSGQSRTIKLAPRLRKLLEDWAERSGHPTGGARVLPDFNAANFRADQFKPWCPGHTPHDMRDTFATTLLRQGVPPLFVSRQLGHKSVQTTLDHYTAFLPSDWEDRAQGYIDQLETSDQ